LPNDEMRHAIYIAPRIDISLQFLMGRLAWHRLGQSFCRIATKAAVGSGKAAAVSGLDIRCQRAILLEYEILSWNWCAAWLAFRTWGAASALHRRRTVYMRTKDFQKPTTFQAQKQKS
jgi:hypothetical protein